MRSTALQELLAVTFSDGGVKHAAAASAGRPKPESGWFSAGEAGPGPGILDSKVGFILIGVKTKSTALLKNVEHSP